MLKHAQRIADAQIWGAGQLLVQPINHSESYYTDYIIKPLKKIHKKPTIVFKAIHEENPNSHIVSTLYECLVIKYCIGCSTGGRFH